MIFKKRILKSLIPTILILFTGSASANYIDIGHNEGLEINALFKVYKFIYVRAQKNELDAAAIGAGFKTGSYLITTLVSTNKEFEVMATYNDRKLQSQLGTKNSLEHGKLRVTAGIGYPFSEKTSAYARISEQGLFVGLRRHF